MLVQKSCCSRKGNDKSLETFGRYPCFPTVHQQIRSLFSRAIQLRNGMASAGREGPTSNYMVFEVALGNFWTGSELSFCGRMQEADVNQLKLRHQFRIGSAVLHLGRHVHAADEILAGERTNLVIWSRSWEWRAAGGDGVLGERAPSGPASSRCTRAKR
mmetsp:Transcript_23715/g.76436  ORF Transcript_23715/g.76436 Transcript_23715/m.76436 type:complete len:159 (-) Transcript_23715:374-850(-)